MKQFFLFLYIFLFINIINAYGDTSIENFEEKYNIKLYSQLNNYFSDKGWEENNFHFKFEQIKPTELNHLLNVIDNCFSIYSVNVIDNCFDKIFLIHNLNLNGKNFSVINSADLLYIAADKTDQEIIREIHKNIAEILFKKYGYLFPFTEFEKNNPDGFKYGDSIPQENIIKSGFLNTNATQSLKEDFINIFSLNFAQKDSAAFYKSNYSSFKKKINIIATFLNNLSEENKLIPQASVQNKISKIEKEYDISININ